MPGAPARPGRSLLCSVGPGSVGPGSVGPGWSLALLGSPVHELTFPAARHRLSKLVLRHGHVYDPGKDAWTGAHDAWPDDAPELPRRVGQVAGHKRRAPGRMRRTGA